MIRHTTDARAHGAGDAPGSITLSASRRRVEAFVRDLGYPADRVEEAVYRFRRERGAMTVEDAAAHLAEWIESIHHAHHGTARPLSVEDASTAFVLSGAAMWSADTLFADPASLPAAHRAAIASGASSVVPDERPLTMPAQDLTGRRWGRRRVEPTVRRLSWVPSR